MCKLSDLVTEPQMQKYHYKTGEPQGDRRRFSMEPAQPNIPSACGFGPGAEHQESLLIGSETIKNPNVNQTQGQPPSTSKEKICRRRYANKSCRKRTQGRLSIGFITDIEADLGPLGWNEEHHPVHFSQEKRARLSFGNGGLKVTAIGPR